ncbi:endothelial differentiation-related factor 1-like [Apostichopus japonicus]|uniref:endothelial differentiation-related factor 1-like n=1 Tax=Stichopus japonicus TaxID=307972 RepID=UPI003AB7258B
MTHVLLYMVTESKHLLLRSNVCYFRIRVTPQLKYIAILVAKMADQDWDTVTYLRKTVRPKDAKKTQALNAARRKGEELDTSMKFNAGSNKQHSTSKDTAKLDRETEELHHNRITIDVGKLIQQGRQDKGMTQKDLATKINEKPQVINDYEGGRAIPNNQIMTKIEKAIGMKLRGKEKGQPLTFGKKK